MTETPNSKNTLSTFDQLVPLAELAVREAQKESRDMGVPNVYFINGQLLYEMPNGELSPTPPRPNGQSSQ